MRRFWAALVLTAAAVTAHAQTSLKLPLPVDSPANTVPFEAPAPVAAVLTGFLWPASGPLTAWAPVYSTLGADGSLTEVQSGGWVGPRPDRWLKVVKKGYVVGGFRVLVRTAPAPAQTRQLQIFWRPWAGQVQGATVVSQVYGSAAGPRDTVRIVEIRLPEGTVPTGLYGQTLGGAVAQASLIVRRSEVAASPPEVTPQTGRGPTGPTAPVVPALK
jgi:hypothetical protein